MGSFQSIAALAALTLVSFADAPILAAEPVTARAGAARVEVGKPSGPTPMVKRGLVLPPHLVDVYVQPFIEQPIGVDGLRMGTNVGGIWGIAPELHADFQMMPFYLPQFGAGTGRIAITRRLVKTRPYELSVGIMTLFDPSAPRFVGYVQPGVAAMVRPNELTRVDTGVQLPVYPTVETHLGFRVPINVYFQITDRVHVGWTSALFVADLRDPRTSTSVPLGMTVGYRDGRELGFAAFTPYVSWTNFYQPGTGAVDTRSFVAGLIADVAVELP